MLSKEDAKNLLDINKSAFEVLTSFGSDNFNVDAKKILTDIALCYKVLGKIEKSEEYFKQAKEYEQSLSTQLLNIFITGAEEFFVALIGDLENSSDSDS